MNCRAFLILALVGALGCGSSNVPPPETPRRVDVSTGAGTLGHTELHTEPGMAVHTLQVAPDSVWRVLPRVYEMLEVPEAGIAPDGTRMYGARNIRPRRIDGNRLSTYIDCGMGITATPKADEYQVTLTLITQLDPAEDGATRVETRLEATARPRATSGAPASCRSLGRLETRVADLLAFVMFGEGSGD